MLEKIKNNMEEGEKNILQDRVPFRGVLEKTELRSFIHAIKSRPDKIIRVLPELRGSGNFMEALHEGNKDEEMRQYRRGKELFVQLREQYHIPVPDFDVVFGETEKEKITAFVIVDRINGEDIDPDDIEVIPFGGQFSEDMQRQIDEVFANLVRYYADIYKRGGEYLADIAELRQWRWGRRVGENSDRLWVVDIDPYFERYDVNRPYSDGAAGLFNSIACVAYAVHDILEYRSVACVKTLNALRLFLKNIPKSHPQRYKLEKALR